MENHRLNVIIRNRNCMRWLSKRKWMSINITYKKSPSLTFITGIVKMRFLLLCFNYFSFILKFSKAQLSHIFLVFSNHCQKLNLFLANIFLSSRIFYEDRRYMFFCNVRHIMLFKSEFIYHVKVLTTSMLQDHYHTHAYTSVTYAVKTCKFLHGSFVGRCKLNCYLL